MPIVDFDALPDSSRIWVFGADRSVQGAAADTFLAAVDNFLAQWRAHGIPLVCARDWRDDRFLVIGVDITAEAASGCSVDGLFRTLQELERSVGARMVGGGRIFYRTNDGPSAVSRDEFAELARQGAITPDTPVFDTTVTRMGDLRAKWEQPAARTWAGSLLP